MNKICEEQRWKILYINANSLIGKVEELRGKVKEEGYHIVAITETLANEDISDGEKTWGYILYR